MAYWFVGPIMKNLITALPGYLQDQYRWQMGMKEELERLRENHPKVQAVVSASTQAQIRDPNSALNSLIWQLRDVIDEANDVLDDFEYVKLEEQLELNMEETEVCSSFNKLLLKLARTLCRVCQRAVKIDPNLKRLEAVVKKLDKVSAEISTFFHLIQNARQEQQELELQLYRDRETGCLPKNDLIGRGEEKDFVMQWLRKPTNEDPNHTLYKNISLLSIVGHGGMGKTTLLQHIYEDLKEEFELKMWVCVSDDFDAKNIIADMLDILTKERPRLESPLSAVQERLKAVMQSKRFLLVLDDIWEEDVSKWENVLSPLSCGSFGSKILITTRMDAVASAITKVIKTKMETLRIKGLEEDMCLKLLNAHAFADAENLGAHKKLTGIASSIVKKLSGSPLYAKVVGGVLNSNFNESFWMKILENNVLNVEQEPGRNNISPILRLSFTFLPQPIQICFAFCGVFSQDHEFDKDDLVRMWIALGFIQESFIKGETLEDIGGRYFDVLVRKSRRIRLLFIDSSWQKKIPEAIKNLRHLRYLNLPESLAQMPRSLSSLYHLRFIIYNKSWGSCSDDFLPGNVSNLSKLRYLKVRPNVFSRVSGIGKLRSLQELNEFNVKNENGYRIGELEHMSELRKLKIHFLENVKDAGEAHTAKLFEKRRLADLLLNWGKTVGEWESDRGDGSLRNSVNSDLDVNVLENLKPYKNLKRLSIVSYKGVSSAKWMYNADLISNLEYISLNGCSEWETLPPLGQLPHLKTLYLHNMPKAKRLDHKFHGNDKVSVFPSLEVLHIKGLQVLEDWFDGAGATADDCFFPCLTELILDNCPNLQELPYLPPKLKKMKIQNIGWKAALNCCGIEKFQLILSEVVIDDPSLLQRVSIASLEKLTICNNDVLVSFTTEAEQWFSHISSSLRELSFEGLKSLQSLPSSLERLSSLEYLSVKKVPQLQQLLQIPASLKELHLHHLEPLQCLPSSLSAISSLGTLRLESIPLLKSLPELPPSLNYLIINSLDNLECLPSSLSAISSLKDLWLESIPLLKSLPELPPSLSRMYIIRLDNLECLPSSLSAISSLAFLELESIPLLKSLPELPPSLYRLVIERLDKLECLPSSLSAISSLKHLVLISIPLLKSLPDLPSSIVSIRVENCHPELMKRYKKQIVTR